MRIVWSLPVRGEPLTSTRGDLVRARSLIAALRSEDHQVIVVEDATQVGMQAAMFTYRTVLRSLLPRRVGLILRHFGCAVVGLLHGLRVAAAVRIHADLIIQTQVAYAISGVLAAWLTGTPLVPDDCSPERKSRRWTGLPWVARAVLSAQARCARAVVAARDAGGRPRGRRSAREAGLRAQRRRRERFEVADGKSWRSGYGLHERCVVGFVGSFQPWHRVELLIDAVAGLPADARIHVVLGGEGPGLESILRRAESQGLSCVTTVGAVPPHVVPSLLAACDVGALPHTNAYGDPMKLREYAAAAIPSVAPDVDPVNEVIEHEVTGLLFTPGDVHGLAEALQRLAADPQMRRRLGEEARRRAFVGGSWMDRSRALVGITEHDSLPACGEPSAGVARHSRCRAERLT